MFHRGLRKIDAIPLYHTKLLLNLYCNERERDKKMLRPRFVLDFSIANINGRPFIIVGIYFSIIQNDSNRRKSECFLIGRNGWCSSDMTALFPLSHFYYFFFLFFPWQSLLASLLLISAHLLGQTIIISLYRMPYLTATRAKQWEIGCLDEVVIILRGE